MSGAPSPYGDAHKRLRRARGRAPEHRCARCPATADEWAYTGDRSEPFAFSWDHNDYVPMCYECHAIFDGRRIEVCPVHGTERTKKTGGWWYCKQCRIVQRGVSGETKRPGVGRAGDRTHCPYGHPYDAENTYVATTKRGGINRMCRECMRGRKRASSAAARKEGDAL